MFVLFLNYTVLYNVIYSSFVLKLYSSLCNIICDLRVIASIIFFSFMYLRVTLPSLLKFYLSFYKCKLTALFLHKIQHFLTNQWHSLFLVCQSQRVFHLQLFPYRLVLSLSHLHVHPSTHTRTIFFYCAISAVYHSTPNY